MKAKAKGLNVKNMKEVLINFSAEQGEFEKIWDGFYQMACLGFITRDAWNRFHAECRGWYIDEENQLVKDMEHDDAIVWAYNPNSEYRA